MIPSPRQTLNSTGRWPVAGLLAIHLLFAIASWALATGAGRYSADLVGIGGIVLAVAIAMLAWTSLLVCHHAGRRVQFGGILVAVTLVLPQVGLLVRLGSGGDRFESNWMTGWIHGDNGQLSFNIETRDVTLARHSEWVSLRRDADGAIASFRLPIDRRAGDLIQARTTWGRLSYLGGDRYWLTISTSFVRSGPVAFLINVDHWPPQLDRFQRGEQLAAGVLRWDCGAFNAELSAARTDPRQALCGDVGTLPPVRSCLLQELAANDSPLLATAVACHPQDAVHAAVVRAELSRRAAAEHDPRAADAALLVALETRDSRPVSDALSAADQSDQAQGATCAKFRFHARRYALARRQRQTVEQGHQLERWLLERIALEATPDCQQIEPLVGPLARPLDRLVDEWRDIQIAQGQLWLACARVLPAVVNHTASADPLAAAALRRWHAHCAAANAAIAGP